MSNAAIWTNWFGNVRVPVDEVVTVRTEDEIAAAVLRAGERGVSVRAHGAGHSNTPIVTSGGIVLDLRPMAGLRRVDAGAGLATFGAATTVAEMGPLLWEQGLSLPNQGDTDSQYLAGAVSTATHGSGLHVGSFSGLVMGARFVTADGSVRSVAADQPALLRAVRTSIGTLGILTEITVRVVPAFNLALEFESMSWAQAIARWDELIAAHDHVSLYWCPDGTNDWVPATVGDAPGGERVVVKSLSRRPADSHASGSKANGTFSAPAWQAFPDVYLPDYHEFEYLVPLDAGPAAAAAIRNLITARHPEQVFPVEIRFCGPDDAMLSPMSGRASCVVSVSGPMGADNSRFFADCDVILAGFGGRPHWGKAHLLDHRRVRKLYPELDAFLAIRADLDPTGLFLTDSLRSLLIPS